MARVRNNVIVRGVSGGLGKQVVLRHMRDGSTVLAKIQDFSKRKFSMRQKDEQGRFRQAVAYAKKAAGRYPVYAERAAGTLKNAYNVALSDWLRPPVIHQVERGEGCIRVRATDNVMVARVLVTIFDEEGEIVEEREAIIEKGIGERGIGGGWWAAAPVREGRFRVQVWDLAGNEAQWVSE